ncbi:MAG TPA: tyrosine-type recombinase/integrase [Kineosporiaceae bacterium]|nr:tyrosine-type recombinase/integrase [Kineosporiaceae bacterium]
MTAAVETARAATDRYLARCKLAANTVRAYRRQTAAYAAWLGAHANAHPDALTDLVGAEAAVTAWRRHLLRAKASPSSVNQALAAVTLLYAHGAGIRIQVKRARVPRPGEPDALTPTQQGALERAAARRGPRDAAIIAVLLYTGARVEECARLQLADVAVTARTGRVHLVGKGDQARDLPLPAKTRDHLSAWLERRGRHPGPLWTGQRGPLTISGLTQVVLAVGAATGLPDLQALRPHRLRHTYATRLRQGGADPAQIQALLGHATLETAARYFRAGPTEQAAVIERIFQA